MSSIKCPSCNLTNWATATSCKRCGFMLQETNGQNYESNSEFVSPNNSTAINSNYSETYANVPPSYRPQPYQQANYQQPNPNYYQNAHNHGDQKRGLAILSLIMGILSFPVVNVMFGILLSVILASIFGVAGAVVGLIIAVVFLPASLTVGIVALKKTNKYPMEYGGKGLAIAGIVLSAIGLVTIPVISAIAIPNLLAARRSANEASAIANMKTIAFAEATYRETAGNGNCGDLNQLGSSGLIDSVAANGSKNGYIFTVSGCDLYAKPKDENGVSATGTRSFYFSADDGQLRASNIKGTLPTKESKVLEIDGFPQSYSYAPQRLNSPSVNPDFNSAKNPINKNVQKVSGDSAGKIF
jgi:type IV pilus assembly protein PilA